MFNCCIVSALKHLFIGRVGSALHLFVEHDQRNNLIQLCFFVCLCPRYVTLGRFNGLRIKVFSSQLNPRGLKSNSEWVLIPLYQAGNNPRLLHRWWIFMKFSLEHQAEIISAMALGGYTIQIFSTATLRAPRPISFRNPPWRSGATTIWSWDRMYFLSKYQCWKIPPRHLGATLFQSQIILRSD